LLSENQKISCPRAKHNKIMSTSPWLTRLLATGALVCCMLALARGRLSVFELEANKDAPALYQSVIDLPANDSSALSPALATSRPVSPSPPSAADTQPFPPDKAPTEPAAAAVNPLTMLSPSLAADPNVARPEHSYETCLENCRWRNSERPGVVFRSPCTNSNYCQSKYSAAKILQVCTFLCQTQYPADCAQARFLIASGDGNNQGVGSYLLSWPGEFQLAVSVGRVFVDVSASQNAQRFTHAGDPDPSCAARNFRCYFVPLTSCSLPPDWTKLAVTIRKPSQFHMVNSSQHRFIFSSARATELRKYIGLRDGRPKAPAQFPLLSGQNTWWWSVQFLGFAFRPNAYMLRTGILPLVRAALAPASDLPARYMNVFMRQGDKWKEAKLRSPEEYFERIRDASTTYNISACYLSSDSAVVLNETLHLVRTKLPGLQVFYLPFPRKPFGLTLQELVALQHTSAIRPLVDLVFADAFVAARAHYWIGTLSSYYCKFLDAYRQCVSVPFCVRLETKSSFSERGHGGYGSAYHSLD